MRRRFGVSHSFHLEIPALHVEGTEVLLLQAVCPGNETSLGCWFHRVNISQICNDRFPPLERKTQAKNTTHFGPLIAERDASAVTRSDLFGDIVEHSGRHPPVDCGLLFAVADIDDLSDCHDLCLWVCYSGVATLTLAVDANLQTTSNIGAYCIKKT